MASTFTIELKDLRFHAAHGLHEEEKIAGTRFVVDVSVVTLPLEQSVDSIQDTVDYVKVYEIVSAVMKHPTPLLETCCELIAGGIRRDFTIVSSISVTITKLSPPIPNFIGTVGVSYTKTYPQQ